MSHRFHYYRFFFVPQISQINTDFTIIVFFVPQINTDFSSDNSAYQMRKNLHHPIDRIGLNLCKSVKSVGHNNGWFKRLDRIGRFPSKIRA